jgi:ribosomal protein L37AE/L43A
MAEAEQKAEQTEAMDKPCPRCQTPMAVEAHFDAAMWTCPECGFVEAFGTEALARDTSSPKRSDHVSE